MHHRRSAAAALFAAAFALCTNAHSAAVAPRSGAPAQPRAFDVVRTNASFGVAAGARGIFVVDVAGDARPEVIASGVGENRSELPSGQPPSYWYVASWEGIALRQQWTSGAFTALNGEPGIGAMDLVEHDGAHLLAVATPTDVVVFELGARPVERSRRPIPPRTRQVALRDVDGDGDLEVLALHVGLNSPGATITALDLATPATLWSIARSDLERFLVADFDNAPGLELAIAATPNEILSATTGVSLWQFPGNYGGRFAAGNFDADAATELVAVNTSGTSISAIAYDVRSRTALWELPGFGASDLMARDLDGDGVDDLLLGNGGVFAFSGATRQQIGRIASTEPTSSAHLAAGDVDGDGHLDVLWNVSNLASGDRIELGDFTEPVARWSPYDEAEPNGDIRLVDLDQDGHDELVWVSRKSRTNYGNGRIHVSDPETLVDRWISPPLGEFLAALENGGLDIGQVDGDPALEIVAVAHDGYDTRLEIFDGQTYLRERVVSLPRDGSYGGKRPRILDANHVVLWHNLKLRIVDIGTGAATWSAGSSVAGAIELGDFDGNGNVDAFVVNSIGFGLWDLVARQGVFGGDARDGVGCIDAARRIVYGASRVRPEMVAFDATTHLPIRTFPLGATAAGAWTARMGARNLLFVAGSDEQLRVFDADTGATQFTVPTGLSRLAAPAGQVPWVTTPTGIAMFARSDFGLHRIEVDAAALPLFADGFE